jgi:hypothetical protein
MTMTSGDRMARLANFRLVPALAGAAAPGRVSPIFPLWPHIAEHLGAVTERIGSGSGEAAGSGTGVVRRFRRRAAASSC